MFVRQSILMTGMLCAIMALSACGESRGERALSGGAIGAGAGAVGGALIGGSPVTGALIGGAVGAGTGALTNRNQIDLERH